MWQLEREWKTLSMLPTQSQTTNQGKSRLNKENERRINNHRRAEHGAASYCDLEVGAGTVERGEEGRAIRKP